jgi:hypothetical protein
MFKDVIAVFRLLLFILFIGKPIEAALANLLAFSPTKFSVA